MKLISITFSAVLVLMAGAQSPTTSPPSSNSSTTAFPTSTILQNSTSTEVVNSTSTEVFNSTSTQIVNSTSSTQVVNYTSTAVENQTLSTSAGPSSTGTPHNQTALSDNLLDNVAFSNTRAGEVFGVAVGVGLFALLL